MNTVSDEIAAAIRTLGLAADIFRPLPDDESQVVFHRALNHFVGGDDRRWWWEAFTHASVCRQVENAWRQLPNLVPNRHERVWFIAEDESLPFYPVYEGTPLAIERVIGECFGFEYYVVAKEMTWLLCENHHNMLIGIGEPVSSRLTQLVD